MRRWILSMVFAVLCGCLSAQNIMQRYDKPFDVSFRVGFNSALPLIHQFTIDDIEITDRQIHYKVGYLAAVTFSVNFNRFTLQPSVSWVNYLKKWVKMILSFAVNCHGLGVTCL